MAQCIGFMQGRLSPPVDGRIQAFPWNHWREEFALAAGVGLRLMEWTLDAARLAENPLMSEAGRREIAALAHRHGVAVESLTGDFFMQEPFHKASDAERLRRIAVLRAVCKACGEAGIRIVVIPLVDAGRIEDEGQEADVLDTFLGLRDELDALRLCLAFESDFPPERLASFIGGLPAPAFGINYDIGNSASLGYEPRRELECYGNRVVNVHVKDRVRGGSTVPLGTGAANFPAVFDALQRARYSGNFILQTARAADGDHAGALRRYRDMTERWLAEAARAA